jgi:hypothetical protein
MKRCDMLDTRYKTGVSSNFHIALIMPLQKGSKQQKMGYIQDY